MGEKKGFAGKRHPLDSSRFLSNLFFSWLNPLLEFAKSSLFKQEHHYNIASEDTINAHKKKVQKGLKLKKRFLGMIFSQYKFKILEYSIAAIISALLMLSSGKIMSKVSQILKNDKLNDPEVIKNLGIFLALNILCTSSSQFLTQLYSFRSNRLSLAIRSSLISLLLEKVLKLPQRKIPLSKIDPTYKSVMGQPEEMQSIDGYLSNLYQIDLKRVSSTIYQINAIISSSFMILLGYAFMVQLVGLKLATCLMLAFVCVNLLYLIGFFLRKRQFRKLLQKKDKRMSYLRGILINLEWVKIRALESFFSLKIFKKREEEIRQLVRNIAAIAISGICDWSAPQLWFLSFIFGFTQLKIFDSISYALFFGLYSVMMSMSYSAYSLANVLLFWMELKVSIKRFEMFLDLEELRENLSNSSTSSEVDQGTLTEDIDSISVVDATFFWSQALSEDQHGQERRVFQTMLSNDYEGLTDANKDSQRESLFEEIGQVTPYFKLQIQDFRIQKGEFVMIVGSSNSGKSSLFQSILGEMDSKNDARFRVAGSVCFMDQKRFLVNGTILENITFGKKLDESELQIALQNSELIQDLKSMNDGLHTVVGEINDTVSGGQRARINLARCFYQDPDIYLLDDPLSSLDNKTARKIIQNILRSPKFKDRTIVMAANDPNLFKYSDKIVYLSKGMIIFYGSYEELTQKSQYLNLTNQLFSKQSDSDENLLGDDGGEDLEDPEEQVKFFHRDELGTSKLKHNIQEMAEDMAEITTQELSDNTALIGPTKAKYTISETQEEGSVSKEVYLRTFKGLGGPLVFLLMLIPVYFGNKAQYSLRQNFLEWAKCFFQSNQEDCKSYVTQIYTFLILAIFCVVVKKYSINFPCTIQSRAIHAKMIFRFLHADLADYLSRTPLGVIINRFSNDIDDVDSYIGPLIDACLYYLFLSVTDVYTILHGVPNLYLLIPIIIYIAIGIRKRVVYMNGKRSIMRLFAITRSPVVGLGLSCVAGAPIIRSICNQKYFVEKMTKHIEENSKNGVLNFALDSWFKTNMLLFNIFVILIPCYGILLWNVYSTYDPLKPAEDNIKIAQFLIVATSFASDYLAFLIEICMVESSLIAIERCKEFDEITPEIGYSDIENDRQKFQLPKPSKVDSLILESCTKGKLIEEQSIFKSGTIEIQNVSAKYPSTDVDVLKDISITISEGQRVGVVGRTGAGKSSFVKLLWRGMKPYRGKVLIDGQDISKLDAKSFRREMMIITQKPCIFEGSISENIDPHKIEREDLSLMLEMLRDLGFDENKLDPDLNFQLENEGSNLSQGEQQILSLVRAVYLKRKLMILDEATAYLDSKTEKQFQKILDAQFRQTTMIIVTHKIQTVKFCDKIAVFDQGRIAEFDSPENLLANPNSLFSAISRTM